MVGHFFKKKNLPKNLYTLAVNMESTRAMRRIFDMFDLNKDGKIDRDELRTIMKSVHLFPSTEKLKEIIKEVDSNKDGVIDFKEFCDMRASEEPVELNVLSEFKK
jgi:Ca2+-binding EF-hand superfamily protein